MNDSHRRPLGALPLLENAAHVEVPDESGLLESLCLPRAVDLGKEINGSAVFQRIVRDSQPKRDRMPADVHSRVMLHHLNIETSQIVRLNENIHLNLARMGLARKFEVTVLPEAHYNAFVADCPYTDRLILAITSRLLEEFPTRMLAFIVGHEIAHKLFNHTSLNPKENPSLLAEQLPAWLKLKVNALSRRREIACDRFGLLFCGDAEIAMQAMLRVMTQSPCSTIELKGIVREFENDETLFYDGVFDQYTPWDSSHPTPKIRAKAMGCFARCFGAAPRTVGDFSNADRLAEVNGEVELLLDAMEMDCHKTNQEMLARLRSCLVALAGKAAHEAGARGKAVWAAFRALESRHAAGPGGWAPDWLEATRFLKRFASSGKRLRVFDFLLAVAWQDQEAGREAEDFLHSAGREMGIPDAVVDKAILKTDQLYLKWMKF